MFLQKNSKILLCVFFRRNQDPALRLYYYLLTAPPLFLYSFPSLISNCLNLPFGTQGRLRRLNETYCLPIRTVDTERTCTQEGPTGSCCVTSIWPGLSPTVPQVRLRFTSASSPGTLAHQPLETMLLLPQWPHGQVTYSVSIFLSSCYVPGIVRMLGTQWKKTNKPQTPAFMDPTL